MTQLSTYSVPTIDIKSTMTVNKVPPWHSAGYYTNLGNPSSFIHISDALATLTGSMDSARPLSLLM